MHGAAKADEPAALDFGPVFLLSEAGMLGVFGPRGRKRANESKKAHRNGESEGATHAVSYNPWTEPRLNG
jgi:hypothetical protein